MLMHAVGENDVETKGFREVICLVKVSKTHDRSPYFSYRRAVCIVGNFDKLCLFRRAKGGTIASRWAHRTEHAKKLRL